MKECEQLVAESVKTTAFVSVCIYVSSEKSQVSPAVSGAVNASQTVVNIFARWHVNWYPVLNPECEVMTVKAAAHVRLMSGDMSSE